MASFRLLYNEKFDVWYVWADVNIRELSELQADVVVDFIKMSPVSCATSTVDLQFFKVCTS